MSRQGHGSVACPQCFWEVGRIASVCPDVAIDLSEDHVQRCRRVYETFHPLLMEIGRIAPPERLPDRRSWAVEHLIELGLDVLDEAKPYVDERPEDVIEILEEVASYRD